MFKVFQHRLVADCSKSSKKWLLIVQSLPTQVGCRLFKVFQKWLLIVQRPPKHIGCRLFKVFQSMGPTRKGRHSRPELSAGGSSTGPIQGLAVRDGGVHVHRRWCPRPGLHCTCRLALRAKLAQGQTAEHRFRYQGLRVRDRKQGIVCLCSGFGPGGSPRPVAVPRKVTH